MPSAMFMRPAFPTARRTKRTLTAPDRETALAGAYDEFNITTPAERKRIIVLAANSPTWT